jgi:predicted phosphodiesterase
LNGTTVQGTKLTSDKTNESMFEAGLDLLVYFITTLSNNFRTLRVHFIKGNHDGVVLSYLGYAVKQYFRDNPNLDVDICKSWAKLFTIDSMAVLAMHGGSDMYKHANIPRNENAMKTYIHEMFLAKNDTISHCKDRVVVSGHLHNFSHRDMGSFDFYTFGTSVVGDKYADALNFPRAKPRQNCLLIRDSKVIATQHYYF